MRVYEPIPMPSEIAEMLRGANLTEKQRRFIVAYLRYLNGSKAMGFATKFNFIGVDEIFPVGTKLLSRLSFIRNIL